MYGYVIDIQLCVENDAKMSEMGYTRDKAIVHSITIWSDLDKLIAATSMYP